MHSDWMLQVMRLVLTKQSAFLESRVATLHEIFYMILAQAANVKNIFGDNLDLRVNWINN